MARPKNNALVSGNAGDERNLHLGGRKFIFLSIFRRHYLFFFSFFGFLYMLVFLVVCFLKLKIYILMHIQLCGWVSDKNIFTRPICGNKTTFFWPNGKITPYFRSTHAQKSFKTFKCCKCCAYRAFP